MKSNIKGKLIEVAIGIGTETLVGVTGLWIAGNATGNTRVLVLSGTFITLMFGAGAFVLYVVYRRRGKSRDETITDLDVRLRVNSRSNHSAGLNTGDDLEDQKAGDLVEPRIPETGVSSGSLAPDNVISMRRGPSRGRAS